MRRSHRRLVYVGVAGLTGLAGLAPAVDRVVADERIEEASGLAASQRFDDVLWVHEDSGSPPVLTALDAQGRTAARLRVDGASAQDWEALAGLTLPDGTPALAVGDIGDNRGLRPFVDVVVVAEPDRLEDVTVRPQVTLRLTYPQRPGDAEALLADPRDGRLYVVSKDLLSATVYAVPSALWPGAALGGGGGGGEVREGQLELVARLGLPLVTDGAIAPDGSLVLRNYGSVSVFAPVEALGTGTVTALASQRLPSQPQGESLALVDAGATVLVGSEGVNQPILSVPAPTPQGAEPAVTPEPVTPEPLTPEALTPEALTPEALTPDALSPDVPRSVLLAGAAGGALLTALVGLAWWALRRR